MTRDILIIANINEQCSRFMSPMHASPYDSVRIFVETKCKKAIGMHWGESPGLSFLILPLPYHTVVALSGITALAHMYMPTPHFY